jgi:fatty-acyl-CoA synthase
MSVREYQGQIQRMCLAAEAHHLLVDREYLSAVSGVSLPVRGFHEHAMARCGSDEVTAGTFVQFSSGSTRDPQGVELTLSALEANVSSMLEFYRPRATEVACSWLPWSHDMGFVGLFTTLCALSPPWSSAGHVISIKPERFLANPAIWLQACSELEVSFTMAPPFALDLVRRMPRHVRRMDLSSIRALVVGSEMVRPEVLRAFADVASEAGLSGRALCPAYGLAEATLGVSIAPHNEPWSSSVVDATELGRGRWTSTAGEGKEIVCCGPPLDGVEVRVAGGHSLGELEIRSPALLRRYVGPASESLTDDGWFHTSDVGHVSHTGDVYPLGRTDDVCVAAGRKVYLHDLDAVVETHPLARMGCGVAIADGAGNVVVVVECRRTKTTSSVLSRACKQMRSDIIHHCSVRASRVIITEPGALPKTPSGKIRRRRTLELYRDEQLPILAST